MPSITQSYEVILDFTNDTLDSATVQLLRDYGCFSNRIVLLDPGESISLVLDAGHANSARAWRDVVCGLSQLFPPPAHPWPPTLLSTRTPVNGITIDRLFRETRFCLFDYNDT